VLVLPPSRPDALIRSILLLATVALSGVAPALAAAAEPAAAADPLRKEEARAHLKRGAQLIDAEDLTGALAEFEAAYRLVPSPAIFQNFGIVYQGLGRKAAALDAFERFLAEAPSAPPEMRAHAQRAVQALRPEVALLRVRADLAGAGIFVDGRPMGRTPQEKPIYLDPGPHQLSVEGGAGMAHTQRVEARAGQLLEIPARLSPRASTPAAAAPAAEVKQAAPSPAAGRARWQRPAAWVAATGAVLAAGLFGVEFYLRYRDFTDFNDKKCGKTMLDNRPPICRQLLEAGQSEQRWAIAAGATAAALGAAAAVLFLVPFERSGDVALSLRASPSRVGLSLQGSF
jgi:tetratricopeptide (TPR) repeat protein